MQKEGVVVVVMLATLALATFVVYQRKDRILNPPQPRHVNKRKYAGGGGVTKPKNGEEDGVYTGPVLRKRKKRSVTFEEKPTEIPRRVTRSKKVFSIVPNAGGGDCLFFCYEKAIKSLNVGTSVGELRAIVAESVTEDQYTVLKLIYDEAERENEYTVLQDYNFMRGAETLEGLRNNMKTTQYWGDEMAIRALEEASGISLCVITKDQSNRTIVANKMDSDQTSDSNRNLVVLLENSHYQIIEYKGKMVLDRDEIQEAKQRLVSIGERVGGTMVA